MFTPTDIRVDAEALLQSVKNIALEQDRYDSMLKLDINQSITSFYYDAWQLKPEYNSQEMRELFDQLGPVGQAKIVSIPPGTSYHAHSDIEDRYHITLQSDHSYLIDLEQCEMYATQVDNVCYHMDTARIHTAVNFGYQDRIQLVVRQLLNRPQLNHVSHVHLRPRVLDEPYNQRNLFDQHILTWLNTANKRMILDNFDPKGEDVEIEFDLESSHVKELQHQITLCGFDILCDIT